MSGEYIDPIINFTWWRSIETEKGVKVGYERFFPGEDPAKVMFGEFTYYTSECSNCKHAVLINKDTGEKWEYTRPDDKERDA
jgi:hypothetical protein